jgi:ATPase involved in DNA repair
LNELNEANLDELDFEELQNQISKQVNAEAITENLSQIFTKLDLEEIGILDSFAEIKNKLSKVAGLSHEFSLLNQRLEENFLEFKDIIFELQNGAEKMETSPEILFELNSKINRINSLFVKHNVNSVEDLKKIRDDIAGEQIGFAELENDIADIEEKIADATIRLEEISSDLSKTEKNQFLFSLKKSKFC